MTFSCMNVPLVTHLFVFLYYYDCGHLQYLLSDWQDERGWGFWGVVVVVVGRRVGGVGGGDGGGVEAEERMNGGQVRKGGDTQVA